MDAGLQGFAFRIEDQARALLAESTSASALVAAMGHLTEAAEREAGAFPLPVACAAGCGTCCRLNVTVLFPEAIAAADYLCHGLSVQERQEVIEALEARHWHLVWWNDGNPAVLDAPCPFLDATGRCSIYPVRPLLCRSVTSMDPEACRQAIELQARGRERPILMDLRRKTVMEIAFQAIGLALEKAGLDADGESLTKSVRLLLIDPGLTGRYLGGERLPG